jgi:hypothetical protein
MLLVVHKERGAKLGSEFDEVDTADAHAPFRRNLGVVRE